MTWWDSDEWRAYEAAYGSTVSRVDELAASDWLTHVVDLSKSEEELWRAIPKTMRQAIRKGQTRFDVYGPSDVSFKAFHMAHRFAFPCTRSEETFELQRGWVKSGHAFALEAAPDNESRLVGAILVIVYGAWAYYASGPSLEPHVMPALIWASMLECKRRGVRWYEVGWLLQDTEKHRSLSQFKQRWGGVNMPAKDAPLLCGGIVPMFEHSETVFRYGSSNGPENK